MGQTLREISSECTAAAIGAEAGRIVSAYSLVLSADGVAEEMGGEIFRDDMISELASYLRNTFERVTYAKASSGSGAIFQIAAIGYLLEELDNPAVDEETSSATLKRIYRLLHSLVDYVEATTDARLDPELEHWCMRRDTTAHTYIDKAFEIAARRLTGEK